MLSAEESKIRPKVAKILLSTVAKVMSTELLNITKENKYIN